MDLSEIWKSVDVVDTKILDLLLQRMDIIERAAVLKTQNAMPIADAARERVIYDRVGRAGGARGDYVVDVFRGIIDVSKRRQREIQRLQSGEYHGLIGKSLSYSHSPAIHAAFGCEGYKCYELTEADLPYFLRDFKMGGLNVTIPYKLSVISLCNNLTETAKMTGSVNCLRREADGTLTGHDTDIIGLSYALKREAAELRGKKLLILGTGGAALTARALGEQSGAAEIVMLSRSSAPSFDDLSLHRDAQVIINATPVGMYPNNGETIISLTDFPRCEFVFDMIYNPRRTQLILQAEELGIACGDAFCMLVAQAAAARSFFDGTDHSESDIERVLTAIAAQTRNIVLVGMPGSGKSTIGALLEKTTGREYIDIDGAVEKIAAMSIPNIFEKHGEEYFRQLEHEEIMRYGKESGKIIVVGGGGVLRADNYAPLRQNGRIYHVERNIQNLARGGRPNSQRADLREMYSARLPHYRSFRDIVIKNEHTPARAADLIWSDFCECAGN